MTNYNQYNNINLATLFMPNFLTVKQNQFKENDQKTKEAEKKYNEPKIEKNQYSEYY